MPLDFKQFKIQSNKIWMTLKLCIYYNGLGVINVIDKLLLYIFSPVNDHGQTYACVSDNMLKETDYTIRQKYILPSSL